MHRVLKFVLAALAAPLLALSASAALAATPPAKSAAAGLETAVFSGGCFWCMESDMKAIPGVVSVESGYTGGTLKNPTYPDVVGEQTGHYESVRVTFDPKRLPYAALLARYWKLVDPTDNGGQFCDRGPSYRPAVFVTPDQRPIALASQAAAAKSLRTGKMLEQILPLGPFYPAEEYHRNYAQRHRLAYETYRIGCGRDQRLAEVWGNAG